MSAYRVPSTSKRASILGFSGMVFCFFGLLSSALIMQVGSWRQGAMRQGGRSICESSHDSSSLVLIGPSIQSELNLKSPS